MPMRYELKEYWDVKNKLLGVDIEEHKVFLMLTYGAMARVGEIVRGKYTYNPPVSSMHITPIIANKGKRLLVITILTEKTRLTRRVPLNRDKEDWLTEPILNYSLKKKGLLFNRSTRWGEKIFEKYFGNQNIHQLRGWRATHYKQGKVTGEPMEWGVICKMGGWINPLTPARYYDGTVIEDYVDLL